MTSSEHLLKVIPNLLYWQHWCFNQQNHFCNIFKHAQSFLWYCSQTEKQTSCSWFTIIVCRKGKLLLFVPEYVNCCSQQMNGYWYVIIENYGHSLWQKSVILFSSEWGISLGLRPREIPHKTHAIPRSDEKSNILFPSLLNQFVVWQVLKRDLIACVSQPIIQEFSFMNIVYS